MNDILLALVLSPIIGSLVATFICVFYYSEPSLNLGGKFKPRRHFFFERCSTCKKRLKHYHLFWGKGDKMFCDVDYYGNTQWYCEKCNEEIHKDIPCIPPTE